MSAAASSVLDVRGRASRPSCRGRRRRPVGPTRRAESNTSMPPPEPRSSTVSPSLELCDRRRIATAEAREEQRRVPAARPAEPASYSASPKRASAVGSPQRAPASTAAALTRDDRGRCCPRTRARPPRAALPRRYARESLHQAARADPAASRSTESVTVTPPTSKKYRYYLSEDITMPVNAFVDALHR